MKTMYYMSDNMPQRISEILKNMMPNLKRDKMNAQVRTAQRHVSQQ